MTRRTAIAGVDTALLPERTIVRQRCGGTKLRTEKLPSRVPPAQCLAMGSLARAIINNLKLIKVSDKSMERESVRAREPAKFTVNRDRELALPCAQGSI